MGEAVVDIVCGQLLVAGLGDLAQCVVAVLEGVVGTALLVQQVAAQPTESTTLTPTIFNG